MQTTQDPLADIAAAAMAHMNSDHADAVLAYARGLAGLGWAAAATVTRIDAGGLDLHVVGAGRDSGRETHVRVPFDPPLTSPDQLRPALVTLAQRAQAPVAVPASVHSPDPVQDATAAEQVFNAIATRRSFPLKDVSPDPVAPALIQRMLDAANWAPSHGQTEPWRFIVFTGAGRARLGEALATAYCALNPNEAPDGPGVQQQRQRVLQAPVWIALGMQPNPKMPEWEELVAFGSAVQNAHLMAGTLGLACKWTSGAVVVHPRVAELIGFTPSVKLYGFLYVGRPVGAWPRGRRNTLDAKVTWIGGDAA